MSCVLILKKIEGIIIMSEFVDIYNNKKEKTGRIAERKEGDKLNKGEYIIVVSCWIVNNDGKILLTQREKNRHNGGMWEPTTGLIISGETSKQGILRELNEEIGITLKPDEINLIKEIVEERERVSFFRDIYFIKKDIKISDLKFLDGSVIAAKYVSLEEFENMIKNKEILKPLMYFIDLYKNNI